MGVSVGVSVGVVELSRHLESAAHQLHELESSQSSLFTTNEQIEQVPFYFFLKKMLLLFFKVKYWKEKPSVKENPDTPLVTEKSFSRHFVAINKSVIRFFKKTKKKLKKKKYWIDSNHKNLEVYMFPLM